MSDQEDVSPSDDDESAKRFRENDDLGTDSHILLRPIRQLLTSGKPVGDMAALWFDLPDKKCNPFGVLSCTDKNRLIFWPILPKLPSMVDVIDHITLEFPSLRSHRTAFKASGKPLHQNAADLGHIGSWRLKPFPGSGLATWLAMAVRTEVLFDQDFEVQRVMKAPTVSEKDRRSTEFARYGQGLCHVTVPLPPDQSTSAHYVYCKVYVVTDASKSCDLTSEMFDLGEIAPHVKGWPEQPTAQVTATKIQYGGYELVIATCCPPGELIAPVSIGLARPAE